MKIRKELKSLIHPTGKKIVKNCFDQKVSADSLKRIGKEQAKASMLKNKNL